ncbi:hypothetical protein SAMN04488519_107240 [Algoriphagus ornithinivorans]|uniref:Uncharacterized protein n=1 Tax=Algoriphagus ornithinivorans TaxID=226506 RepID=A0A1I5HU11_9BACT|nr:hypothetical protein [Algoriphagus ornithinivorans]SFO51281.1 hypothetical protein SAMN04488519_107240 [Algoriphagus ornithinivorans]
MKKINFSGFAFALIFIAFASFSTSVEASGPFGSQGHWVNLGDGSQECMTHWWNNDCKVGDTRGGSPEGLG